MITVIIPLYNKERSILKTVSSVLTQSFTEFELLIVNDGSTDNSLQMVSSLKDPRLRIINKENGGVSSARNTGIKEATNEWIALLDADDLWKEDHLKNFYNSINQNPEARVISSGYQVAKADGTILTSTAVSKEGFYNFFQISLQKRFIVNSSSIIFNKSFYKNLLFNERISKGEDLWFWEQLAKRAPFYLLPDFTSIYIDDSENKAVYQPHPLEKTHVYLIDSKLITDKHQKKYYINLILHSVFLFFEKQQTLKDALKIYQKHRGFIGLKGFYVFARIIFQKRFNDKI